MKAPYNKQPVEILQGKNKEITVFEIIDDNIERSVVQSFGEEWQKFQTFSDKVIADTAKIYFDVLDDQIINKNTYALDVGCGTGRWSKYLTSKIGFVEAIDPSKAIFAADNLLGGVNNVRLAMASTDSIPFNDETFDFVMSVGVLHHIPDTQKAMADCVKKVKKGGYFYCYLYHSLESLSILSKFIFLLGEVVRKIVSKLPKKIKHIVCDILAIVVYMPFIVAGKFAIFLGLKKLASKMPLKFYFDQPFFIVRNDALDKFGTSLENRFTKEQVIQLMTNCGLTDIKVSTGIPLYHAVGRKA